MALQSGRHSLSQVLDKSEKIYSFTQVFNWPEMILRNEGHVSSHFVQNVWILEHC